MPLRRDDRKLDHLLLLDLLLVFLALLLHLRHLVERERLGLVILGLVVPILRQRPVLRPLRDVVVASGLQLEDLPEEGRNSVELRRDDHLLQLLRGGSGSRFPDLRVV